MSRTNQVGYLKTRRLIKSHKPKDKCKLLSILLSPSLKFQPTLKAILELATRVCGGIMCRKPLPWKLGSRKVWPEKYGICGGEYSPQRLGGEK